MKAAKPPSGNWSVNIFIGKDLDGRQHRKRFTGPDRKTVLMEAAAFAAEHRSSGSSVTFLAAAEAVCQQKTLSPAALRGYDTMRKKLEGIFQSSARRRASRSPQTTFRE